MHSILSHPRFSEKPITVKPATARRQLYRERMESDTRPKNLSNAQILSKRITPNHSPQQFDRSFSVTSPHQFCFPHRLQLSSANKCISAHHAQRPEALVTSKTVKMSFCRPLYPLTPAAQRNSKSTFPIHTSFNSLFSLLISTVLLITFFSAPSS